MLTFLFIFFVCMDSVCRFSQTKVKRSALKHYVYAHTEFGSSSSNYTASTTVYAHFILILHTEKEEYREKEKKRELSV